MLGGLSPLSPTHPHLPCVPLLPSTPHSGTYPASTQCCWGFLGVPGTPRSHLLEVTQGLRLGKGTHLQVPEETRLHQRVLLQTRLGLSTRGAMAPPWLSQHGVLVTLTPRLVLGSWEGTRASSSQMS